MRENCLAKLIVVHHISYGAIIPIDLNNWHYIIVPTDLPYKLDDFMS